MTNIPPRPKPPAPPPLVIREGQTGFKKSPSVSELLDYSRIAKHATARDQVEAMLAVRGCVNVKIKEEHRVLFITYSAGPSEEVVRDDLEAVRPAGVFFIIEKRRDFNFKEFLVGVAIGVASVLIPVLLSGCDADQKQGTYTSQTECEQHALTICEGLDEPVCEHKIEEGWEWVDTEDRHWLLGCIKPPMMFDCLVAVERKDEAGVFAKCSVRWDVI